MKTFINNPVASVLNINYSRDSFFIALNLTFLILSQSLVTYNQYCGKPAEKTTICNVPWPLFYWAMRPWPCSAWSMGKRGRAILSPELGATAELGRDWDPAAAASHEGQAIPPWEARQPASSVPLGVRWSSTWGIPKCAQRKPCIPEQADAAYTELGAVVQVLLLLWAGSTPVMPEEAQGLVPDTPVEMALWLSWTSWTVNTDCLVGRVDSHLGNRGSIPTRALETSLKIFIYSSLLTVTCSYSKWHQQCKKTK